MSAFLSWRCALSGVALVGLSACNAYFNSGLDPELSQRVAARLGADERLTLEELAKTPPQTVDEALKTMQRQRGATSQKAPALEDLPRPSTRDVPTTPQPERLPLTLAEARARALENNLSLRAALFEPGIAATQVSEEEAKFDDLIFANAKYANKDWPLLDGDVVQFKSPDKQSPVTGEVAKLSALPQESRQFEAEVGVQIPLRTGGKLTVVSPLNNKRSLRYVPSDQYLSALRFSFSQPLLRDAGIAANVAKIRIARYQQRITDLETRLQAIRVIAMIDKLYWELYAAWGELDVRRQQYEIANQNLAMVKKRVAEGLSAAIEINRAEIGVADRLEALVVATTKIKLTQRKLLQALNDPQHGLDTPTLFVTETAPLLVRFDLDREQIAAKALAGRLELLEIELKLAADRTKIDYLENQTLPQFMLDYSYGALGRSDGDFGAAYGNAFSGPYDDWAIGLKVEIPLTNELRKSQLRRAVQQRLQRLTTRDLKVLSVKREIYDALDTVEQNWQRILITRQNVGLAGVNYDAEIKQFKEGLRTMTEVLETLTKLGDAQLKEIKAIADYQIALIDLAYATGTLLGYSRVDLPQALLSEE